MSDNIGGTGTLLVVAGPPIAGAVIGALVAKKHRVVGGLAGFGVGLAAVFAYGAYVSRQSQAAVQSNFLPATTLQTGTSYGLSLTSGGDPTATAQAAGFTSISNINGTILGTWSGANNAPVPVGLIAKH